MPMCLGALLQLHLVFSDELIASGLSLSTESQSNAADKRLLDILRQA